MTSPVTTEALVDLVARLRTTSPWKKTAIAEDLMREAADALQQVTAERDRYRDGEEISDVMAQVGFDRMMEVCKERDAATSELARLRAEGEAKDRDNAVTALMVIALCNSVLGNAYLGKEGEAELAANLKSTFTKPALARAATAREGA